MKKFSFYLFEHYDDMYILINLRDIALPLC